MARQNRARKDKAEYVRAVKDIAEPIRAERRNGKYSTVEQSRTEGGRTGKAAQNRAEQALYQFELHIQ